MVEERGRRGPGASGWASGWRWWPQVLLVVAMAIAGVAVGRVAALLLDDPAPVATPVAAPLAAPHARPGAVAAGPAAAPPEGKASVRSWRRAAEVLHAWDVARASAYARGDPAALRGLYAPRSRAGARDVAVLGAYRERGLLIRGLRTQLLSLRVLLDEPDRLRLEVTDRRVGGRAVGRSSGGDAGVALPRDGPTTRVLVLRRDGDDWLLTSVRDL